MGDKELCSLATPGKGAVPKVPLPLSCLSDQATAASDLPLQVPRMCQPVLK